MFSVDHVSLVFTIIFPFAHSLQYRAELWEGDQTIVFHTQQGTVSNSHGDNLRIFCTSHGKL